MARFAKWADWRTMARDLSNAMNHLTQENFDASAFRFSSFVFDVTSVSTMPLQARSNLQGTYFLLGTLVLVALRGEVTIDAGGVADSRLYVSLPFPYDPTMEDLFRLHVNTSATLNSDGAFSQLIDDQWVEFWQEDGAGNAVNWTLGDTVTFNLFGFYAAL